MLRATPTDQVRRYNAIFRCKGWIDLRPLIKRTTRRQSHAETLTFPNLNYGGLHRQHNGSAINHSTEQGVSAVAAQTQVAAT